MLKPIKRIVTGHTDEGRATFIIDEEIETTVIPTGDAAMATIWSTAKVPADCNDNIDGRLLEVGTTLKGGSVIRVVDMLPGASSPMHRTSSIDYGIVMKGAIELELENGEIKTIEEGGIIVQRGTIHRWRNPNQNEKCRIVFVLTEAKPFEVNGKPLPDEMIHE
ncbi:MAG: cupin domain-containing protein [Emticicia sp.]|uniref:cupin domain-containing protein n=1 Tax=Emticicia sp. TaxID=1930953 RepID=UPI003BA4B0F8